MYNRNQDFADLIDKVDSHIFTGGTISDPDNIALLKTHLERWERAIKRQEKTFEEIRKEKADDKEAPCKYCGGTCPQDEENACDGYLGDIDGLYSYTTLPEEYNYYKAVTRNKEKTIYLKSESDYKHSHGLMMEARCSGLIDVFDDLVSYEKVSFEEYSEHKY